MEKFYFGIAKSDITPELGCLLYGYPRERRAERVLDRLSVGAAAMKQGDKTVILMNTELCAFNVSVCDKIRMAVSDSTGVGFDDIVFAVTHTHSGPVTHTSEGWGEADLGYIDEILIPASIKAAKEALANTESALICIGKARCMAGINRRETAPDGSVILGQNSDGAYDDIMTTLSFRSEDGRILGTTVQYACHPTVAGSNFSITRDWPGVMIDMVEEATGAPCIYFNGAEGNVGPRLSNGKTAADDSFVAEIGRIAGKSALEAIASNSDYKVPELKSYAEDILLPYAQAPTMEKLDEMIAAMGDPDKLYITDLRLYNKYQRIRKMLETGESLPKGIPHRQTVIAVGELALVPFCFEAFTEFAISLRSKSPFAETAILGLSSGTRSYLPTEEQLPYGGYEVTMFRSAGLLGFDDRLGDHLVSECVRLLKKL